VPSQWDRSGKSDGTISTPFVLDLSVGDNSVGDAQKAKEEKKRNHSTMMRGAHTREQIAQRVIRLYAQVLSPSLDC